MKLTGITRNVDTMGRVVIPKEMRQAMGVENGDPVDIIAGDNCVIIQRHEDTAPLQDEINSLKKHFSRCCNKELCNDFLNHIEYIESQLKKEKIL